MYQADLWFGAAEILVTLDGKTTLGRLAVNLAFLVGLDLQIEEDMKPS